MKKNLHFIGVLTLSLILSKPIYGDHPPNKLMRNMSAWSQLGNTGKLGKFDVNFEEYGTIPKQTKTSVENKKFDRMFKDKFNLATIVMKDNKIVYERYNSKRKVDSNTPLLGMSMSKTAASASIGVLLCENKIKSLDDTAGIYSTTLNASPYANIKIKNILQMNSGVSPLGRHDEKKFNRKSLGLTNKFSGKASVREALSFYKKAAREQGSQFNYHSSDTLALSILVEEISKMSVAKVFYDNLYTKFGSSGYMHWAADKNGTTAPFTGLTMTAHDWAKFGKFIMEEKKASSCLGSFFNEGVANAITTGKKNGSRYGYQSWVFMVNENPTLVLQGHGGQFLVLDELTNTILLTISINEKYTSGNLFNNIHKFTEKLN